MFITPDLESGDHLHRRQVSAIVLMVSSLLAIVLSFIDSEMALWALALNFAVPLIRNWRDRRASQLNRLRRFIDYGIFGSRETWMKRRARGRE
jgi:hypothetical protein